MVSSHAEDFQSIILRTSQSSAQLHQHTRESLLCWQGSSPQLPALSKWGCGNRFMKSRNCIMHTEYLHLPHSTGSRGKSSATVPRLVGWLSFIPPGWWLILRTALLLADILADRPLSSPQGPWLPSHSSLPASPFCSAPGSFSSLQSFLV